MTYKVNDDVSLAFGASMTTGSARAWSKGGAMRGEPGNLENPLLTDKPEGGLNNPKYEEMTFLRGGTAYGGVIYKGNAYFIGSNTEKRLHDVQNWIHRAHIGNGALFKTPISTIITCLKAFTPITADINQTTCFTSERMHEKIH